MRHYLIYILSFTLFLGACSREDFKGETSVEEIVPPSEEKEVGDINGIVKGNGEELLDEAIVQLYSETELVQETTTNSFGEFQFIDVLEDEEYKIFVQKNAYIFSIALVSEDHFDAEDIEINLFENIFGSPLGQPTGFLDSDYVLLYGNVTDNTGELIEAEIIFYTNSGTYIYQNRIVNGEYATLIPKGEPFTVFISASSFCSLFPDENHFEALTENTKLDFNSDISFSSNVYVGSVMHCDSTFLEYGLLSYNLESGLAEVVEIIDGEFEVEVEACEFDLIQYEITDEFGEFLHFGFFEFDDSEIEEIIIDCGNGFQDVGNISLNIGNADSIDLEVFGIYENFTDVVTVFAINEEENCVFFQFQKENSNSARLEFIKINLNGISYVNTEEIFIDFSIEEISSFMAQMSASFSGEFISFNGQKNISSVMEIPLYVN